MATLNYEQEYVFILESSPDICYYSILDAESMGYLAQNTTKQSAPAPGDSYYFSFYFGGEEPASAPVTISYNKDLCCGTPNCDLS
jgi:hypothetical protein